MSLSAIVAESRLDTDLRRIFMRYPSLEGNTAALQMLDDVSREYAIDEGEIETREWKAHEDGAEQGYDCAKEDYAPFVQQVEELLACLNAPKTVEGERLLAELPEAIKDVERELEALEAKGL